MKMNVRNVFITTDTEGAMAVRLNYSEPERPVVKVLKHGDASVGINAQGAVVYVRLENAQLIDRTFKEIQVWALNKTKASGPTQKQKHHLEAHCMRVGSQLALAYAVKHIPETKVKYKVERLAAAV